jgi:ABC-type glycerol-3-phosphate transport system permease component
MSVKYLLIILITLIVLWPVYWMVQGSFQDHWGVFSIPSILIPQGLHTRNYEAILSSGYTLRWIWNTTFIVTVKSLLVLGIVASAGMGFALYRFAGKKVIFWMFISTIMIPGNSIIIGKFLVTRSLGLANTLWAGFIPVMFYATGIYLFRTFVEELPSEIIDSARVDGTGEVGILTRIVLPLCRPAAGVIILFTALGSLGNLLWQSIVLQRMELKTLLVGMVTQMQSVKMLFGLIDIDPIGLQLAAGCILFVPNMLLFVFFNKRYIKELRLGALLK